MHKLFLAGILKRLLAKLPMAKLRLATSNLQLATCNLRLCLLTGHLESLRLCGRVHAFVHICTQLAMTQKKVEKYTKKPGGKTESKKAKKK